MAVVTDQKTRSHTHGDAVRHDHATTAGDEEIMRELSFHKRDPVTLQELERFIDDGRTFELDGRDYTVWRDDGGLYHSLVNKEAESEVVCSIFEMQPTIRRAVLEDAYELRCYFIEKNREMLDTLERYDGKEAWRLSLQEQQTRYKAIRLLEAPENAFLRFRLELLDDYHFGDSDLKTFMLRCANRPAYDSTSPLVHIDTTGKEGTGKSGLMDKVLTTIPSGCVKHVTSISPTALYYDTLEQKGGVRVNDPTHYHRKIIAIAEANDSAGWMAIKAFAEADQFKEYEHMATQNGEALKMKVKGARSVWITSVHGINDAQVLRRFVHCSVDKETAEIKRQKVELMTRNLLKNRSISNDSRLPAVLEGMKILWSGVEQLRIVEPEVEVQELIQYLGERYVKAGYSTTSVSQFYTLCETAAFEKRFQTGRNKNVCRTNISSKPGTSFMIFGQYSAYR